MRDDPARPGRGSAAILPEGLLSPPTTEKIKRRHMRINILGTDYLVKELPEGEDRRLEECTGYCDQYTKTIVVNNCETLKDDVMAVGNIEEFKKRVLRHEIIHAFLCESGLQTCSEWAENEEMVDWFATQFSKIEKVFQEIGLV